MLRDKALTELTEEWDTLREAYVEIMVDAGRHRSRVEARLDSLQAEYLWQRERQMQDFNRRSLTFALA